MGDALTPHGIETEADRAPSPSAPKRNPLRASSTMTDQLLDGFTDATNRLFRHLASLLGALLFPSRRLQPAQLRRLADEIRSRTARFDSVQALSDPDVVAPSLRGTLRRRVNVYERELVRAEYRSDAYAAIPTIAATLSLLLYAALVIFDEGGIARVLRVPISFNAMTNGLFWALHLGTVAFFFQLPNELMRVRRERGFRSGFADYVCALMPAILGVPCLAAAYAPVPLPIRFLLLAVGQAGLYYVAFLALFMPLVAFLATRRKMGPRRAHPDAFIAHEIILTLIVLEAGRGELDERTKYILLGLLDAAARTMRDELPLLYRAADLALDVWLTESARQWAAALSDLKKWVVTPKHDTREYLTRHLASQLAHFVAGTWDGLERREPEAVSRRRIGRALIAETARIALAAGAPPAALVLIQHSPLALAGAAAASATLTVVLFALVVVLSALVPDLDKYLATTKSVLNLVTFGKRE